MALIQLKIDEQLFPKAIPQFAGSHGWSALIQDPRNLSELIPNPVSAEEFTNTVLIEYVKSHVIAQEVQIVARQRADQLKDEPIVTKEHANGS